MRQLLQELFNRLGINSTVTDYLEAIIYSLIIGLISLIFWMIVKRLFRLIFSNISKRTKSKFDDFLIKNKIPETLSLFPPLLLLLGLLPRFLKSFPLIEKPVISLLEVFGAIVTIILVRRLLNSFKDFFKTLENFKDEIQSFSEY